MRVVDVGDIEFFFLVNDTWHQRVIQCVLYVHDLKKNILSIS
jgi:hypothetical protein